MSGHRCCEDRPQGSWKEQSPVLEAGGIIQARDSSAGGAGQDPGDAVPTLILSTGCSRQPP